MTRAFYPVTFTWRDATGRMVQTRLYWAGDVAGFGKLDDGPGSFSAVPQLIDPAANDGIISYLQACSNAALVGLDGPFPDQYLLDFGYDEQAYGVGSVPYASVEDVLEVVLYTQPQEFTHGGDSGGALPPPDWRFRIPAPVGGNFSAGHRNALNDGITPISLALSQFLAFVSGNGARWDDPGNDGVSSWCSREGVYVTNVTALPRVIRGYSRLIRESYRTPDLTEPAL